MAGVVLVLLPGFGSVDPAGTVTVAVFAPMVPLAGAVPLTVIVRSFAAPAATFAVRLTLPMPLTEPQIDVPDATHVQLTFVSCAGTVSLIVAPTASAGPALFTTSV